MNRNNAGKTAKTGCLANTPAQKTCKLFLLRIDWYHIEMCAETHWMKHTREHTRVIVIGGTMQWKFSLWYVFTFSAHTNAIQAHNSISVSEPLFLSATFPFPSDLFVCFIGARKQYCLMIAATRSMQTFTEHSVEKAIGHHDMCPSSCAFFFCLLQLATLSAPPYHSTLSRWENVFMCSFVHTFAALTQLTHSTVWFWAAAVGFFMCVPNCMMVTRRIVVLHKNQRTNDRIHSTMSLFLLVLWELFAHLVYYYLWHFFATRYESYQLARYFSFAIELFVTRRLLFHPQMIASTVEIEHTMIFRSMEKSVSNDDKIM